MLRVAVAPAHSDAEAFDRGIVMLPVSPAKQTPPFVVQNALRSFENLLFPRLTAGLMLLADMDAAMKKSENSILVEHSMLFVWKF